MGGAQPDPFQGRSAERVCKTLWSPVSQNNKGIQSMRDDYWCYYFRGEIIQKVISNFRHKSLQAKLT